MFSSREPRAFLFQQTATSPTKPHSCRHNPQTGKNTSFLPNFLQSSFLMLITLQLDRLFQPSSYAGRKRRRISNLASSSLRFSSWYLHNQLSQRTRSREATLLPLSWKGASFMLWSGMMRDSSNVSVIPCTQPQNHVSRACRAAATLFSTPRPRQRIPRKGYHYLPWKRTTVLSACRLGRLSNGTRKTTTSQRSTKPRLEPQQLGQAPEALTPSAAGNGLPTGGEKSAEARHLNGQNMYAQKDRLHDADKGHIESKTTCETK